MSQIAENKPRKRTKSTQTKRSARHGGLTAARLKKMIARLLTSLENDNNSNKASVGELLKLIQYYKEMTTEQVKEVEVRWVDRLREEPESET